MKAICCDTTASNLEHKEGAAKHLEKLLDKDLLYLPCRHHIFEWVLGGVFDALMPPTTGPSVLLFKRFQDSWYKIDQQKYKVGITNQRISAILQNEVDDIYDFINKVQHSEVQPRDDYRELLLLCLIFMNKIPREDVKFYKPGAFSRARWMAKAIYSLKIFMFRDEFHLTASEKKSLTEICLFIVKIYVKAWFMSPLAAAAPEHDLKFLKSLHDYREINSTVSQIAIKRFSNHLWYLSSEAAAMAFFDNNVSNEI